MISPSQWRDLGLELNAAEGYHHFTLADFQTFELTSINLGSQDVIFLKGFLKDPLNHWISLGNFWQNAERATTALNTLRLINP